MKNPRAPRWYRDVWLLKGTPRQRANLEKVVTRPVRSVLRFALIFAAVEWVLFIRSNTLGPLIVLAVESVVFGIFMFVMLRWRHRAQYFPPDRPISA